MLITYSIIDGNTPDDAFQLHPTSGRLTLRRPLHKQQDGQQFYLTVTASDGELNDTANIAVTLLVIKHIIVRLQLVCYLIDLEVVYLL